MTHHRLPNVPILPNSFLRDVWDVWCHCGWGATCNSPEAAVIGAAEHIKNVQEET